MDGQTLHAPAKRTGKGEIELQSKDIESQLLLQQTLNSLPYIAAIINQDRQIIYSNELLLKTVGLAELEDVIGKRTGEAMRCIHAFETPGGCGTSEACRYCGAVNAIIECQSTKESVAKNCQISSNVNGKIIANDFEITVSPIQVNSKGYMMITLKDMSSERRRRVLEKIFFHDVINTAGSLRGLVQILNETDDLDSVKTLLNDIDMVSNTLLEEITAQRDILAAERGELSVEKQLISSHQICKQIVSQYAHHTVSKGRKITIASHTEDVNFISDIRLLRRVISNMVKNALEAVPKGGEIVLNVEGKTDKVIFSVYNEGFIPRDIQLQMFQRSFSTKGRNRGIGTYSMKLIAENYLGGKVYFETDPQEGTTFFASFART